jgi:hypothetical protein
MVLWRAVHQQIGVEMLALIRPAVELLLLVKVVQVGWRLFVHAGEVHRLLAELVVGVEEERVRRRWILVNCSTMMFKVGGHGIDGIHANVGGNGAGDLKMVMSSGKVTNFIPGRHSRGGRKGLNRYPTESRCLRLTGAAGGGGADDCRRLLLLGLRSSYAGSKRLRQLRYNGHRLLVGRRRVRSGSET